MASPVQKRGRGFSSRMEDADTFGLPGRLEPPNFSDEEEQRTFKPKSIRNNRPHSGSSNNHHHHHDGRGHQNDHRPGPNRKLEYEGGVGVPGSGSGATSRYPASAPSASTQAPFAPTASKSAAAESPGKKDLRDRDGIQLYIPGARRRALSSTADAQEATTKSADSGQPPPVPSAPPAKSPAATGLAASRYAPSSIAAAQASASIPDSTSLPNAAQAPVGSMAKPAAIHSPLPPSAGKGTSGPLGAPNLEGTTKRLTHLTESSSRRQPKGPKATTSTSIPNAAPAVPKKARSKPPPQKALTDAMKKLPPQHESLQSQHAPPRPQHVPQQRTFTPKSQHHPSQRNTTLPTTAAQSTSTVTATATTVTTTTTTARVSSRPASPAKSQSNSQIDPAPPTITPEIEEITQVITSYQLAEDERFATESSDSTESVTSSLGQYEPVSDDERAMPKRRVSQGAINYPIAENEPPYVPMSYTVPESEMIRLLGLQEKSPLRVWSHLLYNNEDGKKVTVECCVNLDQIEVASQKFLNEKAIGFDLEWLPRPSPRVCDNVSLIQLAKEDHIALIQLARIQKSKVEELVPPSLRKILESKDILKLGVSVGGDGGRINKWLGIEVQGLMELSAIHHLNVHAREKRRAQIPKTLVALSKLSALYLKLPIAKGPVRMSDWTRPLSPQQISYAATDAYAGLRIYDILQQERMAIDPIPMLPPCVKYFEAIKKPALSPRATTPTKSTWDDNISQENLPIAGDTGPSAPMDWATMVEDEEEAIAMAPPPTPAKRIGKKKADSEGQTSKAKSKADKPPLSSDMQFALEWSETHRMWRKIGKCTAAPLKAYALWHVRNYDVEHVADLMGIQPKTAAAYITQAVKNDQLEVSQKRYNIVWSYLPRMGTGGFHDN